MFDLRRHSGCAHLRRVVKMFYRLLTVAEAREQGVSIFIEPTVLIGGGSIPKGATVPMLGARVQLRLPGSETRC